MDRQLRGGARARAAPGERMMTARKKTTAAAHDSQAVACTSEQRHLGEGSRWDARRGELLSVDILTGRVYRDTVGEDGALTSIRTDRKSTRLNSSHLGIS